ncbi:MAG: type II toxin-antitoxin system RatA family toxin [Rhodospirillaceae bacterium]|jgi:coenzyme Q-binding protein COQ10|nr:type II toxin-antitoxin system RatA family toxin [Rhodospirillaceae bacterium]
MPIHTEKRVLPYRPEQIFALVADVEKYPEFLPWCVACRKTKIFDDGFEADLAIGFKMVREKFTSRVTLNKPDRIEVAYLKGPFSTLSNIWRFTPVKDGDQTEINFSLDFEFSSRVIQKLIGVLFEEAVRRMVAAFEARASYLYGSSETD